MPSPPRKRFGQHFLHEQAIIQRIIDAIAPDKKTPIVEIGPGLGALTIPLLQCTKKLDVIEIDRDLAHKLIGNCRGIGQLCMHNCDALKFDFRTLHNGKLKVIGNLPYNITTPLLFHLLNQIGCIEEMLFMMQKEVVDRICANPHSRDYGRLTVMLQSQCQAERLFAVSQEAFLPPPNVKSSVVRLTPLPPQEYKIKDQGLFGRIVKQAFNHRRKTLRNALKGLVDEAALARHGIASTSRAENLTVHDYARIANTLYDMDNQ
ncbi:MAG: 16S rRNA (adenine(1518)-N(6)/adenine(1519)-N(6))-dimethyltransferase RsmA [Gammaproteobacteria bacterium]